MANLFGFLTLASLICLIVCHDKPNIFSRFIKEEPTRNDTGLIFGLLFIIFLALFTSFTSMERETIEVEPSGGEEKEAEQATSRCLDIPANVVERIESGLDIAGEGYLRNVKAVKSNDFESVYFVSGDLQGAGLEGENDLATFATNQLDHTGLIFSVNTVAAEFSVWPLGRDTDSNITMSDDGARESYDCVSQE